MPDVKIPGIGNVEQKWVFGGAALVLGIVGYAWWKRGTAAADTTIPVAGTVDDAFTDASQDAYQGAFGTPALTVHPDTGDSISPPTTNDDWTRRAIEALTTVNYDPTAAAAALGKYITRQALSGPEADMVRYAVAVVGPPPVGSFPITSGSTGGTATPETAQLWDAWQSQNLASGTMTPGTEYDWGMLARRVLPSTATRLDVYSKSLELQAKYPDIHRKYPMYVPANVAAGIV